MTQIRLVLSLYIKTGNRLVPLVDKTPLPLRIIRLVTPIYLQVENPTHATAHAPEKIFNTSFRFFSVAIIDN